VLAVKKLEKSVCNHQKEEDFLELVNGIDRTRHVTIVNNGSLYEALHSEDEFKTRLTWNARIRIALGAARALEFRSSIFTSLGLSENQMKHMQKDNWKLKHGK
ncbi:hypothetical protein HN873_007509, partial [Arachis hypogaea]